MNKSDDLKNWTLFFDNKEVQTEIEYITSFLETKEYLEICPEQKNIFRCFRETSPEKVKFVLLGMDPYHNTINNIPVAQGLAFHLENQSKINPSLRNIYKELERSGFTVSQKDGNLLRWTEFCLLLNTALTVEKSKPGSHSAVWKKFTELLIQYIDTNLTDVTFLLMGNHAQNFQKFIKKSKVLVSSHPSPFSANKHSKNAPAFIGSDIFKKTMIDWSL